MSATPSAARSGALIISLAGLLFLVYPIVRPYSDETTMAGARAMASGSLCPGLHAQATYNG